MPVNADHAGVIRFRDNSDPTYQSITEILKHQIREINEDRKTNPDIDSGSKLNAQ